MHLPLFAIIFKVAHSKTFLLFRRKQICMQLKMLSSKILSLLSVFVYFIGKHRGVIAICIELAAKMRSDVCTRRPDFCNHDHIIS